MLLCKSAAGIGGDVRVVATVGSLSGTLSAVLSYNRPSVSGLMPRNAGSSGVVSLTVVGSSFGEWDSSGKARLGGSSCVYSEWVSDSALVCVLSGGFKTGKGVAVSVADQYGGVGDVFSYDGPRASGAVAANAATSGLSSVTVVGEGFGLTDGTV